MTVETPCEISKGALAPKTETRWPRILGALASILNLHSRPKPLNQNEKTDTR